MSEEKNDTQKHLAPFTINFGYVKAHCGKTVENKDVTIFIEDANCQDCLLLNIQKFESRKKLREGGANRE